MSVSRFYIKRLTKLASHPKLISKVGVGVLSCFKYRWFK